MLLFCWGQVLQLTLRTEILTCTLLQVSTGARRDELSEPGNYRTQDCPVCVHMCLHVYEWVCVCVYTPMLCVCSCMCVPASVYMHVSACMSAYICVNVCVCLDSSPSIGLCSLPRCYYYCTISGSEGHSLINTSHIHICSQFPVPPPSSGKPVCKNFPVCSHSFVGFPCEEQAYCLQFPPLSHVDLAPQRSNGHPGTND